MNESEHANPQPQAIQLGRLTPHPDVTPVDNGSQTCDLSPTVESIGRGGESGYVDVSTFGEPGKAADRIESKRWLAAVDGRLDYRHSVADDGANRSAISVVANVELLAAPPAAVPAEQAAAA